MPAGRHANAGRWPSTHTFVVLALLGVPGLWLNAQREPTLRGTAATDHPTQPSIGFIGLGDQGAPAVPARLAKLLNNDEERS